MRERWNERIETGKGLFQITRGRDSKGRMSYDAWRWNASTARWVMIRSIIRSLPEARELIASHDAA